MLTWYSKFKYLGINFTGSFFLIGDFLLLLFKIIISLDDLTSGCFINSDFISIHYIPIFTSDLSFDREFCLYISSETGDFLIDSRFFIRPDSISYLPFD